MGKRQNIGHCKSVKRLVPVGSRKIVQIFVATFKNVKKHIFRCGIV